MQKKKYQVDYSRRQKWEKSKEELNSFLFIDLCIVLIVVMKTYQLVILEE